MDVVDRSLRARWSVGQETLGAWVTLPSTTVAEVVARVGFDYVCIDLQHGYADISGLVPLVQAVELAGGVPIARVPWNEPGVIGRALDAGCHAVIVPMVDTVEQAAAVVAACHYPPLGRRSWGPMLIDGRHGRYRAWADRTVAVIPMIEKFGHMGSRKNLLGPNDSDDQLTSDHGWDTVGKANFLRKIIGELKAAGIRVSIFVDPNVGAVEGAKAVGADRIELYTGPYAHDFHKDKAAAVADYHRAALRANEIGIGINAGHDLNLDNLRYFKAQVPDLLEVSIGQALISDALYYGLENTIQMYLRELR